MAEAGRLQQRCVPPTRRRAVSGANGPPPRDRTERSYNVQRWFVAPRGGHFPALEVPDMFVHEPLAFFAPLR
jgi:epoxide hydrolase